MKTKQELQEARAAEDRKRAIVDTIVDALPDDLPGAPTISNERETPKTLDPVAWLHFSGPSYDPDRKWNPVAVLQSLERAGWTQTPATLCKWDNYRRAAEFGTLESIPEEKPGCFGRQDKLTDCAPIAPVWIRPQQHGKPEAALHMKAPDGRTFKVLIDLPGVVSLGAKRNEYRGGWSFERGTGTVRFPEKWHGHQHCTINENTRGYVDTEQGLSGAIYFSPHMDQSEWPMTASEFLESLLTK